MKVLVAYDGTLQSKDALRFGLEKVRDNGGRLVALHVFNSSIFIDYDAVPTAEGRARDESLRHVEDAKRIIEDSGKGIQADVILEDGDPEEEVIRYARAHHMDILLCPPRYRSILKKYRQTLKNEGREAREHIVFDETERVKMGLVSLQ